ncbi:MAG: L-idonate 5-dehydrogenase [Stappiaceae bacterium]
MKSKICRLHGVRDLRVEEIGVEAPAAGEVLISVGYGGICGSDLHYYIDGGIGPIRVTEPIIIGHEAAGTIEQVGAGVTDLAVGDVVAINPSQPCDQCSRCEQGMRQHCFNMRFLGSARTTPHVQGAFREKFVVDARQCEKVGAELSLAEAACSEPLAVCLHARNQAGDLAGKRVLVTGAGPIGSLCAAVSAQAGAKDIVITDLHDFPLSVGVEMGATAGINVDKEPDALSGEADEKLFDVVFECSASEAALRSAIAMLRPRGTLVQVGVAGDRNLPLNQIVGKEIRFVGTHRFDAEFQEAAQLINEGAINVKPLITQTYALKDAGIAFEMATDRTQAVKVQLAF